MTNHNVKETKVVKDVDEWITVRQLHKKGMSIRGIARELKMSKNTVKKLLRSPTRPTYQRKIYPSKVEAYKEQIKTWYLDPSYNFIGTRIYEELLKIGYDGSIGPVYRYLSTLQEQKRKISTKATVRFETPPGDQAQFDWAHYKLLVNGTYVTVYCFAMVLSYSRYKAMVCSLRMDADAVHKAIEDLYFKLDGVTIELMVDNPKALIIEHLEGKEPKYTRESLILAAHLGVELNACQPYRARTKGKVERPFNYLEEHFIKGNTFESMTDLNQRLDKFIENWNNKLHTTTKRIPKEAYQEEKSSLLPLPRNRYYNEKLEFRKVSLDSLVMIKGKKYSVPVSFVEQTVSYKVSYGYLIEIFNSTKSVIATYDLTVDDSLVNKLEEHYDVIKTKVSKSIPEIKRLMISTFSNGEQYLVAAAKKLEQPTYHARRILSLLELYPLEHMEKVLDYCITQELYRIEEIKSVLKDKYIEIILESKQLTTSESTLIRSLDYYDDGGTVYEIFP